MKSLSTNATKIRKSSIKKSRLAKDLHAANFLYLVLIWCQKCESKALPTTQCMRFYLLDCNFVLNDENGIIKSPGSPKYKHDLSCTWKITVPLGNFIVLNTKSFFLESSYNCESDALYIYDGSDEKSPLYSRPYCDIKGPSNVLSKSNSLFLKFITDHSVNGKGFELVYHSEKGR